MFRLMEKARKNNNKGFSLVELIVVVLIIAIIAVALAPQVVKYVGQARNSVSENNAATIKSAVQAAVAEYQAQSDSVAFAAVEDNKGSNKDSKVAIEYTVDTNSKVTVKTGTDKYTSTEGKALATLIGENLGSDKLDKSYTVIIKTDSTVTVS